MKGLTVVTHILVLAALLDLGSTAPRMIEPHTSRDACFNAASKRNLNDPEIRTPEALAKGMGYICMSLEYPV